MSFEFAVLGGGICGLSAAYEIARNGRRVVLLEKAEQLGGVIQSQRDGDWLLELGPNSLGFREDDDVHGLLKELDLEGELLMQPVRDSDRYIWRGGQLRRVPISPLELFRQNAISRRTLARALPGLLRRHNMPKEDVSVGAWFSPIVGRQAVEQLLAPALAGIYAADPFSLSMQSVMPRLHSAAQTSKSIAHALRSMKNPPQTEVTKSKAGMRVLASFRQGMSTLPQRLAEKIRAAGGEIITGYFATHLQRGVSGCWTIDYGMGNTVRATNVLCTLPAGAAAELTHQAAPELSAELRNFRYTPLVVAHVGVWENEVAVSCKGFGYLATRGAGVRALGMIWSDRMFADRAPKGHRLFTVFLGGQIDPQAINLSDSELLDIALGDLRTVMKWRGDNPAYSRVTKWNQAIPLMEVGHAARVRRVLELTPDGLHMSGNTITGVSLPSCIRASVNLAKEVMQNR